MRSPTARQSSRLGAGMGIAARCGPRSARGLGCSGCGGGGSTAVVARRLAPVPRRPGAPPARPAAADWGSGNRYQLRTCAREHLVRAAALRALRIRGHGRRRAVRRARDGRVSTWQPRLPAWRALCWQPSTASGWRSCARSRPRQRGCSMRAPDAGASSQPRARPGYDASGIEPSARGVDGGGRASASRSIARRIEDAAIPAGLARRRHAVARARAPRRPGRRARADRAAGCAPAAALLVGVPNLASLQARIGGERWYHLDVPRHRVHFTPAGLRRAARARTASRSCDTTTCSPSTTRSGCGSRSSTASPATALLPLQPAQAQRARCARRDLPSRCWRCRSARSPPGWS